MALQLPHRTSTTMCSSLTGADWRSSRIATLRPCALEPLRGLLPMTALMAHFWALSACFTLFFRASFRSARRAIFALALFLSEEHDLQIGTQK